MRYEAVDGPQKKIHSSNIRRSNLVAQGANGSIVYILPTSSEQ